MIRASKTMTVQIMFDTLPTSIEHIRGGRPRALAVTTTSRRSSSGHFDRGEVCAGLRGKRVAWHRCAKNTPVEIIERLNWEINAGLADAKIKILIIHPGYAVFSSSSSDFGKFIVDYTDKWGEVIQEANIQVT
jgi:tripartite-type tricarboxylate transporter receptor subunit TctC